MSYIPYERLKNQHNNQHSNSPLHVISHKSLIKTHNHCEQNTNTQLTSIFDLTKGKIPTFTKLGMKIPLSVISRGNSSFLTATG